MTERPTNFIKKDGKELSVNDYRFSPRVSLGSESLVPQIDSDKIINLPSSRSRRAQN